MYCFISMLFVYFYVSLFITGKTPISPSQNQRAQKQNEMRTQTHIEGLHKWVCSVSSKV